MASLLSFQKPARTPVYFLGIGGPNFMEETDHPAYSQLVSVGQEITTNVKPKAVVVFSAHWQAGPSTIQINAAEETDLIYDFYGFPPLTTNMTIPIKGVQNFLKRSSKSCKMQISMSRESKEALTTESGRGSWLVAFDPVKNPLNVPIVQVSLFGNEDWNQHYHMGQALESLRDEGILIIGAGMAVHNLRDYRAMRVSGRTMPYVYSFDEALKDAVTSDPEERRATMSALIRGSESRDAHPTLEHILPLYVAAGAAGSDRGERIWTLPERSLSWAQYRFGPVE